MFAHWYSGTLRVPQGRRLKYVHSGFQTVHELDLLFDVERGRIVSRRTKHNGVSSNSEATSPYIVDTFIVYANEERQQPPQGQ